MAADALALFWDRLDWPDAAFTGDEVAAWPAALGDALIGAAVLRRISNARRVECDSCDGGHVEDIQAAPGPGESVRFFIRCPENGRLSVPEERVHPWTADLSAPAALGWTGKPAALVPGRVWGLGRLVRGPAGRTVVLARGLTWPDARKAVRDLRKICIAAPPVVLAVGRPPSDDLWGNRVPTVLALDQSLHVDGTPAVQGDALDAALGLDALRPGPARRKRQRSRRADTIDALTKAMHEHLKAARDHAYCPSHGQCNRSWFEPGPRVRLHPSATSVRARTAKVNWVSYLRQHPVRCTHRTWMIRFARTDAFGRSWPQRSTASLPTSRPRNWPNSTVTSQSWHGWPRPSGSPN